MVDDEALLDRFQKAAFHYFLDYDDPGSGLVADGSRPGAPASIAALGFALSCYPVAVERGWLTRAQALGRTLAPLRFLWNSPQGEAPDATGYRGFYYHFLDMETGRRTWGCEVSVIDTALLIAGVLCAAAYFDRQTPGEREVRRLAEAIYQRVDWPWARGNSKTMRQGWTPERGFLRGHWVGYDEAAIVYVLGLAAPRFPLPPESYRNWTAAYEWIETCGRQYLYAGPLFIHQFSHAWIDFRGIQDAFMREKNSDYFENSRRAVEVQREYARRNPHGFAGFGEDCWGFTACEGPGRYAKSGRRGRGRFMGYAARGAPFGPDDGTISPSAAVATLPFAPEAALAALRHVMERYPEIIDAWRLPGAFNPSRVGRGGAVWVADAWLGLDAGLLVLMIENHRSGLIWRLMKRSPHILAGLRRAGFAGGWLGEADDGGT